MNNEKQLPDAEFSASWWVKFNDGKSACVDAKDEGHAIQLGSELSGKQAVSADRLPYPATPRLNANRHPKFGMCPAFCYRPDQCKGRTSCPQNYACSE